MAQDNQNSVAPQLGGAPVPGLLPTQGVSQFTVAMQANDILLSIGHNRISVIGNADGTVTPQLSVEWLLTLSMSGGTAQLLSRALGTALETYEKMFGKIPADPKMQVKMDAPVTPK